eukprot:scaffold425_cov175-Amphora_coffeaeformis.AAC.1
MDRTPISEGAICDCLNNVGLRCLHDGGEALLPRTTDVTNITGFHGAVVNLTATSPLIGSDKIDPNASPSVLTWGACGITTAHGECLKDLVHPTMLARITAYTNGSPSSVFVDPWKESLSDTSPFNLMPEFAYEDERQRRIFNPIMKNTLTGKCAPLLTADLLKGRSFLDLGACLGASTYWALCMGSSRAVAVEVQESFCQRAEVLLGLAQSKGCWNVCKNAVDISKEGSFEVVCSGVREYLSQCKESSHDVILAAGILHCFADPIEILREMARVATHAILLEVTHPGLYGDGYLDDPEDHSCADEGEMRGGRLKLSVRPLRRHVEGAGILQLAPRTLVNMADNDSSFLGSSVVPSRLAVEASLKSLGFEVTRVYLAKHPSANEELVTYTVPRNFKALPTRYLLRCVRKKAITTPIRSLESIVVGNDRKSSISTIENPDTIIAAPEKVIDNPEESWSFDSSVAIRFEREAKCHIPDYEAVVADSIVILEDHLRRCSAKKENVKVVDVGCATGYTLVKLHHAGFRNIFGVDTSTHMISRAKETLQSLDKDLVKNLFLSEIPTALPHTLFEDEEKVDAAFVNWTLQFVVNADARRTFLANIASQMKSGALLILTEKTVQNELTKKGYYDFKRSNGISEEEISIKESRLRGVLEPFRVEWYFGALRDSGFEHVCISRAKFGFVTFVAIRRQDDDEGADHRVPTETFKVWPDLLTSAKAVKYETNDDSAPFRMYAWGMSTDYEWNGGSTTGTVYGFIYDGTVEISVGAGDTFRRFTLFDGMYFACPGACHIRGGSGIIQVVEDHKAMFAFGGPVESIGRLPYIDGCTDSLLLAPATKGAPCVNHLHFPPGIVQTQHTHPSGRSGIVIRGGGFCVCDGGKTRTILKPGTTFVIPTDVLHAFETSDDEELDVIAFHPDSDFGPSPNDHPMINRTIVNGVSASRLGSIQTKHNPE